MAPPLSAWKHKYIEGMDQRQQTVRAALGRAWSAALVWDLPIMEKLVAVDYCFGLLSFLLLQGVLNVEGRSLFTPGKCCKKKSLFKPDWRCCMQPLHWCCIPAQHATRSAKMLSARALWCPKLHFLIHLACAGNDIFDPREDTDPEGKILARLLQKSLVPVERNDPLGEI